MLVNPGLHLSEIEARVGVESEVEAVVFVYDEVFMEKRKGKGRKISREHK